MISYHRWPINKLNKQQKCRTWWIGYLPWKDRSRAALTLERSKTAKSSNLPPPTAAPLRRSLCLKMKQNPALDRMDSRFPTSSVEEEEEEEEVGFRPLKVIGRPIDKGSVNTTQGQRWSVSEVGENLGQERIIESHTVGPEVQEIQNPVEALFPIERIGVAPGVSAGLVPQRNHNGNEDGINLHFRSVQGQENEKNKVINLGARPKDNVTSFQFLPVGFDPQWENRKIRPTETQEVRRYQSQRLTDELRVCANNIEGRNTFSFPPKDLDLIWREQGFRSAFTRGRQEANMFSSAAEALEYCTVTRQAATQAVNAGDYPVLTSKIDGAPQQSMVTCDAHRRPTVHSMPIVSYTTVEGAPPPFLQTSSRIYDVSQTLSSTDAEPSWKQPPLERIVAFAPCSSTNIMVSRATQTGEPPASSVSAKDAINHDVEVKHSPVSSVVSEKSKNVLKLEKFSGKGSLQVFLKRFDICSRHNGWSPSDRKDHLMISLTDSAAQLIWESSEIETAEDLIKRLEDRFGLKYQQAVYRVQLENRRQGPGETLSSLMTDIRRLLALAYPTEH